MDVQHLPAVRGNSGLAQVAFVAWAVQGSSDRPLSVTFFASIVSAFASSESSAGTSKSAHGLRATSLA